LNFNKLKQKLSRHNQIDDIPEGQIKIRTDDRCAECNYNIIIVEFRKVKNKLGVKIECNRCEDTNIIRVDIT